MTKEEADNQFELMLDLGMAILREKDIKFGAMGENFKPVNHLLSTKDNARCWCYLANQYVLNTMMNITTKNNIFCYYDKITSNKFYDTWRIHFLQSVENVVRYGQKSEGIENIVNGSGISRETLVKFLD